MLQDAWSGALSRQLLKVEGEGSSVLLGPLGLRVARFKGKENRHGAIA
jgi:hypothetical protein